MKKLCLCLALLMLLSLTLALFVGCGEDPTPNPSPSYPSYEDDDDDDRDNDRDDDKDNDRDDEDDDGEVIPPPSDTCHVCGEDGTHDRCEFCQVHTCVGIHTSCAASAAVLSELREGEYTLCGQYDYDALFGNRDVPTYIRGAYVWAYELTISEGTYTLDFFIDETSATRRLVRVTGNTTLLGNTVMLTPVAATAYSNGFATSNNANVELDVNAKTTRVKLYADDTFSGIVNLPFDICATCGGISQLGTHGRCDACGERVCNGADHVSLAACGLHKICAPGVHDERCDYCGAPTCNGLDHGADAPCGIHPLCSPGDHDLCEECRGYRCNGDTHEECSACGIYLCVGEHGGCTVTRCPGCSDVGVVHAHCSFCQKYLCVGDHTNCKAAEGVTVVTGGFSGAYLMSGEYRLEYTNENGYVWVSFDWQLKTYFLEDGTYRVEWWQKSPSQPNYFGPLKCWVGTYEPTGESFTLVPTGGYTCDLTGEVKDQLTVDITVRTTITMYSDNTFTGYMSELIGFCDFCGAFIEEGETDHTTYCEICGGGICAGDHLHGGTLCDQCGRTTAAGNHGDCPDCSGFFCDGGKHGIRANCGVHTTCSGGMHGNCLYCGRPACNGEDHGPCTICSAALCTGGEHSPCEVVGCEGYLCDGDSHGTFAECGEHYTCGGGDHTVCTACGARRCDGGGHDACTICGVLLCTPGTRHMECEYSGCDGHLCDGDDHFHGGFNCFDHEPDEDDGDCTTPILCALCDRVVEEGSEEHAAGDLYAYDNAHHWQMCTNPGCTMRASANYEAHTASGPICLAEQKCEYCDYMYSKCYHSYNISDNYLNDICSYCGSNEPYIDKGSSRWRITLNGSHTYLGYLRIEPTTDSSFYNIYAPLIEEIYIGMKVTNISTEDFRYCTSLKKIEVSPANPNYMSIDGVLYSKDGSILYAYPLAKEDTTFTMPSKVLTVNFFENPFLETLILTQPVDANGEPDGRSWNNDWTKSTALKRVEAESFAAWCGNKFYEEIDNPLYYLHDLYINGEKITEAVLDFAAIKESGSAAQYLYAGSNITSIRFENAGIGTISGSTIPKGCFLGCTNLTEVTIPKGVGSINEQAFKDCTALKTFTIALDCDFSSLSKEALSGTAIKSLVIPSRSISWGGLAGMMYLEEVALPIPSSDYQNSYTLGYYFSVAEEGATGENLVTQTHYDADGNLVTVTYCIPDSLRKVYLFSQSTTGSLTDLRVPSGMFWGCENLTEVHLPAGLSAEQIYENAFYGCDATIYYDAVKPIGSKSVGTIITAGTSSNATEMFSGAVGAEVYITTIAAGTIGYFKLTNPYSTIIDYDETWDENWTITVTVAGKVSVLSCPAAGAAFDAEGAGFLGLDLNIRNYGTEDAIVTITVLIAEASATA